MGKTIDERLDQMGSNIETILQKMNIVETLQEDVKKIDVRVTDLENSMSFFELDIHDMKVDLQKQPKMLALVLEQAGVIDQLKSKVQHLETRMESIDSYSRR